MSEQPNLLPPGALFDVRVLDLTDRLGGYCTKLLAELGADVVKVEPPDGSFARHQGPFYRDQAGPETSLWWWQFNANKRGITLDLDTADGQAVFKRLAASAAVLVEDTVPGTMAARGLAYEDLRTLNPGLIYTSITPYGQTGPYARYRGSDLTAQAMAGMMTRVGWPEDPPGSFGADQAYNQAGAHGTIGTLMALYYRDITGEGQHVDVSMHEAVAIADTDASTRYSLRGEVLRRNGGGIGTSGLKGRRIWPCRDGEIRFQVIGPAGHREWPALLAWMQEVGMAEDLVAPQWQDPFYRVEHLDHLEEVVGRFVMTMDAQYLMEEGQRRRVMIFAFQRLSDVARDRQLLERGFFNTLHHDDIGETLTYPGGPYRLSESPWRVERRAPHLGEHNADILQGELGLTAQEMARLRASGVI